MRNKTSSARGTETVVYQSSLTLSTATLTFLGDMAGGNDISATTVRRWVLEVIGLLAARAERLDRALKKVARKGGHVVLIDGTLIRTRRRTGKDNRRHYSGKHKAHGLLFLALTDDRGRLLWISAARPGRSSEITTARYNHLVERLRATELGAIGDLGFVGLDDDPDNPVVITGYKGRPHQAPHLGEETGQQADRVRPRGLRTRLRAPQELAHPHQAAAVAALRDHPATGPLILTNTEVAR
ncbi:hypothetical protein QF026_001371 [Streptomyces aurantiacus]|nr:hypothetical protein [Streptomyces aurantiacus]